MFADFFNYIMNLDGDMAHVPRHLQAALTCTSPPLPVAVGATPDSYQSDNVIDSLRSAASAGNCSAETMHCHIPFHVPENAFEGDSTVGITTHGGGAADPRSYSVLARLLTTRHGLPSVIPVFANDLAFDFVGCDTGRIQLAAACAADQVPLPLVVGLDQTIAEKGRGSTCVSQPKAGMEKRFCTIQVIFRAVGEQPQIAVIFRGTGKKISAAEKAAYASDVLDLRGVDLPVGTCGSAARSRL